MAWYVVHVGRVPGMYLTWEDCYAQVNQYLGNCYKKYNTEAKVLRAYYGPMSANHSHPRVCVLCSYFYACFFCSYDYSLTRVL